MKKIRIFLALAALAITSPGFSQGEANWWHFGYNAGLKFPFGPPVAFGTSLVNTSEGSASISDAAGNVLFYTDGITVWNKVNAVMANGTGLMGNPSSTQSGVIVKRPGSATLYYIFTTDAQAAVGGLRYSIVDMSLAAGNGSVTVKNALLQTPSTEKVTGVRHCNNNDVWIVSHDWNSNNFRTFLLTAAGVGPPVLSAVGITATGGTGVTIGQLKASPNGRKLGSCIWDNSVNRFEIFDFNNLTGVVSNQILIPQYAASSGAYGCEFSPDGTKFYGTLITPGQIRQWDLCAGSNAAIIASAVLVGTSSNNFNGSLQLGPDGKLYVARLSVPWVGVINNPNTLGVACGYVDNGVSLAGKNGSLGLPNFVPFYFKSPPPPFTFTVGTVSCLTAQFNAPISTTTSCASSGYTINAYTWNFGDPPSAALNTSTLTNPTHIYPGPGTYSVSLILNYPCGADTIKQNITVVSPSVTVNTTSATCSVPGSGTATAVGGTGPYTYTWTPTGQTTQVATGLTAGVYTVQVKDAIGCIVTKTVNVASNNVMTGTVTSTSVLCNGSSTGSASLTITGGTAPFSYTWTSSASTSSVATGLAAGIYTVIGKDASAVCAVTQTVQITQPPVVTLTASASSPTACAGNNITLTAAAAGGTGAGYTYTWTAGPSTANYIVNQTGGAYTYTVSATDGNGCLKTTNITVNFINNPSLTTTSSTICVGQVASLTANGATSYVWNPGGFVGSTYTLSPANTTTMTVTGANGACSATTTAVVNVNTPPVVNIVSNNVQCNGQSNGSTTANTTGSGPFNYVWSTVPVQNSSTANNLIAGNYNVTVTDANGCVRTASATITQPTALNLAIVSNTNQVCAGSSINLNANGAGGTGVINYVWNPGPNTSAYSVTQTVPGNYNYTVTATDANGCVIASNINLTYNPQPTVTASSATICAGQVAVLTANGANTYLWSTGATGSTFTTTANSNTNVSVIGTAIGCTGTTNANIVVNALPNISISASVLSGCTPLCSDLKSASSSSITNYMWTVNGSGIGSGSVTTTCFNQGGTYTVGLTVTDNNGCLNSSNPINLIASAQPVADFNYDPIKPLAGSDLVSFTDASFQNNGTITSWQWYFMNSAQYTSTMQNPNFTYADAGDYVIALIVKNDKGCTDTILKSIQVGEDFGIYMPNSFTPNADGLNDTYYGKGFGIKKMEMQIFDRWGEKVFISTDLNEAWDGTMVNKTGTKIVQEGTYTWRIKLTNVFGKSKELTGHVTLIK